MTDLPRSLKYGKTRVRKIRDCTDTLRKAIQSEGTPAIQDAWDRYEQFIQYPMDESHKTKEKS